MAEAVGRNNHAPAQPHKNGVLRLGDLTPERLEIELNGRMLKGWMVANQRYPASVAAELEDARQDYLQSRVRIDDPDATPQLVGAARSLITLVGEDDTQPPSSASLQPAIEDLRAALKANDEPRYRIRASEWEHYVTASLQILIPGLEDWEADMLGPELRMTVLQELGYFRSPEELGEVQAAEVVDGERSSTGDEPQPVSPVSIA